MTSTSAVGISRPLHSPGRSLSRGRRSRGGWAPLHRSPEVQGVCRAARLQDFQRFADQAIDPLRLKGGFFIVFGDRKGDESADDGDERQAEHQRGDSPNDCQGSAIGSADIVPRHRHLRQALQQTLAIIAAAEI